MEPPERSERASTEGVKTGIRFLGEEKRGPSRGNGQWESVPDASDSIDHKREVGKRNEGWRMVAGPGWTFLGRAALYACVYLIEMMAKRVEKEGRRRMRMRTKAGAKNFLFATYEEDEGAREVREPLTGCMQPSHIRFGDARLGQGRCGSRHSVSAEVALNLLEARSPRDRINIQSFLSLWVLILYTHTPTDILAD